MRLRILSINYALMNTANYIVTYISSNYGKFISIIILKTVGPILGSIRSPRFLALPAIQFVRDSEVLEVFLTEKNSKMAEENFLDIFGVHHRIPRQKLHIKTLHCFPHRLNIYGLQFYLVSPFTLSFN